MTLTFRMPKHQKEAFYHLCQHRNVQMTSQMNVLIDEFIRKEHRAIFLQNRELEVPDDPMSFFTPNEW